MDLDEYQRSAGSFAIYPRAGDNLVYPVLGLTGEAGEVADSVKRIMRDDGDTLTAARRSQLAGELGDVLWYVSQVASELDLRLSDVAEANLDKLRDRAARDVVRGQGSDR